MDSDTERPVSLLKHLESLPDPRSEKNRKHLLVDVVAIAACGVLVGCDGPTAFRLWAEQLDERRRVDRAKHLLMMKQGLTEDQAYQAIRKLAMDRQRKLSEAADDVVAMLKIVAS